MKKINNDDILWSEQYVDCGQKSSLTSNDER